VLHPEVLTKFNLSVSCCALEINVHTINVLIVKFLLPLLLNTLVLGLNLRLRPHLTAH
jgi:phenylalanyl-tRNA synthetase beta subunit